MSYKHFAFEKSKEEKSNNKGEQKENKDVVLGHRQAKDCKS